MLEVPAAGATAVQVGTANFKDPGVRGGSRAARGYCERRGVTAESLVGRAAGLARREGGGRRVKGTKGSASLDFPAPGDLAMARLVADRVGWLKVGLEAFVAEGPSLIADVAATGAKVFLDLKLHDIPATVAGAVVAAARSGAEMVNVHASGGRAMLEAAREAADRAKLPRLIAVTLLTSLDAKALADLPMAGYPEEHRAEARAPREGAPRQRRLRRRTARGSWLSAVR